MKSSEIKLHGEYAVKDGSLCHRVVVAGDERYARNHLGKVVESDDGDLIPVDVHFAGDLKPSRRYFRPNAFVSAWADFSAVAERQLAEAAERMRIVAERHRAEGVRLEAVRAGLRAAGIDHGAMGSASGPQVVLSLQQGEALLKELASDEATFRRLVAVVSDASGGNAAFDTDYGMDTLNRMRRALGLPALSRPDMDAALDATRS